MRAIDATLKSRLLQALQTQHNNANPSMEVLAIRPRTPITRGGFWQESIVAADETAVCTSVAVRRTGANADRVFVAFVDSSGTLTVKSAPIMNPVANMTWTVEETIEGCTACSLEFEGRFRHDASKVVFYTNDTPYLFYTTATGALMGGVLGETPETIAAANVTAVDAIRGVRSLYGDIDQGMIVFYIVSGSVYYKEHIGGSWGDQLTVSLAPASAVAISAERTFDWRIILQVEDNTGTLFEIFSKMQASGWNSSDYLEITDISAAAGMIAIDYSHIQSLDHHLEITDIDATAVGYATYSPTLLAAENIMTLIEDPENPGEFIEDYGYRVVFAFDQYIPNAAEYPGSFKIEDDYGTVWYGQSAEVDGRFVTVSFNDFNNASNPITATALAGDLTNGLVALTESSIGFSASGLVPTFVPPPIFIRAFNNGSQLIVVEFDKEIETIGDASGFDVYADEPEMSPEGNLIETHYTVDAVDFADIEIYHEDDFSAGAFDSTVLTESGIRLEVQ